MPFATEITDESKEKIILVIASPRIRVTGWTLVAANTYEADFTLGVATGVWDSYFDSTGILQSRIRVPFSTVPIGDEFSYDHETKKIRVYGVDNPDDHDQPGLTVQFEIPLSTRPIYGQRDPFDSTNFTDVVDWIPAITNAPFSVNGSRNDLFGFQPVNIDNIEIANDGWMNPLLYGVSWNNAPIKAFMLVGDDYERAISSLGVVQIYMGYVSGISETDKKVSLTTSDYTRKLDNNYVLSRKYNPTDFPLIEPAAFNSDGSWYIRKIYGVVDAVEGVNVDYNAIPSTTNNRDYVTHLAEGGTPGDVSVTIDHLAANTATRTYFLTTPPFNVYDSVIINNNVVSRVPVAAVNRDLKYIDHPAIVRIVSAGNTVQRLFIGAVYVVDRDGNIFGLDAGTEYTTYVNVPQDVLGFTLADNVEAAAGFFHTPFDPSRDKIYCRVYGNKDLQQYSDLTDVGSLSTASGVVADGVSLIFKMLISAGFTSEEIDTTSFTDVGSNSHTLGIAIPASRDSQSAQTFKEIISQFLTSQIWKLNLTSDASGKLRIGLSSVQPFPSPGDYFISNTEFTDVSWEQDYGDIYSIISASYKIADSSGIPSGFQLKTSLFQAENVLAKNVHFVNKTYAIELRQIDQSEAESIANRLSFILGDRRGIYKLRLPFTQLINSKVGVNYQITRDHLPGFSYEFDAGNQRTLNVVEVQKDPTSVSLILDDQKGIQDNSGSW